MASVRMLKKDIDYLVQEIVSDSYLTIYFHPEKKDDTIKILEKAVEMRNDLIKRVNHPAEKNNRSLVRKHYQQIRLDMYHKVDSLFEELSSINK